MGADAGWPLAKDTAQLGNAIQAACKQQGSWVQTALRRATRLLLLPFQTLPNWRALTVAGFGGYEGSSSPSKDLRWAPAGA